MNGCFSSFAPTLPLLLRGAGTTLLLALSGTFVGFVIGLAIGSVRAIPVKKSDGAKYYLLKIVNAILSVYIEVFRSTPMIVQAMVIFYGAAQLLKITMPNLLAGFIIVSINTGAYLSEIVRGGIQSVDPGQREAAQAIGMTYAQTMRISCSRRRFAISCPRSATNSWSILRIRRF